MCSSDQAEKVTGTVCPTHGGGVLLVHSGCVRSGAGVVGLKKPPNAWSTFGTRSMVLMPGTWLPAGGGVICTTQLSKTAWRLESRLILPYGPSTTCLASADCSAFWPPEMSPWTCTRAWPSAVMADQYPRVKTLAASFCTSG